MSSVKLQPQLHVSVILQLLSSVISQLMSSVILQLLPFVIPHFKNHLDIIVQNYYHPVILDYRPMLTVTIQMITVTIQTPVICNATFLPFVIPHYKLLSTPAICKTTLQSHVNSNGANFCHLSSVDKHEISLSTETGQTPINCFITVHFSNPTPML